MWVCVRPYFFRSRSWTNFDVCVLRFFIFPLAVYLEHVIARNNSCLAVVCAHRYLQLCEYIKRHIYILPIGFLSFVRLSVNMAKPFLFLPMLCPHRQDPEQSSCLEIIHSRFVSHKTWPCFFFLSLQHGLWKWKGIEYCLLAKKNSHTVERENHAYSMAEWGGVFFVLKIIVPLDNSFFLFSTAGNSWKRFFFSFSPRIFN